MKKWEGFFEVDVDFECSEGCKIMAIGDMNSDKHLDIVTINKD